MGSAARRRSTATSRKRARNAGMPTTTEARRIRTTAPRRSTLTHGGTGRDAAPYPRSGECPLDGEPIRRRFRSRVSRARSARSGRGGRRASSRAGAARSRRRSPRGPRGRDLAPRAPRAIVRARHRAARGRGALLWRARPRGRDAARRHRTRAPESAARKAFVDFVRRSTARKRRKDATMTGAVKRSDDIATVGAGADTKVSVAVLTMRAGDRLVSVRVHGTDGRALSVRMGSGAATLLVRALHEAIAVIDKVQPI